MLCHKLAICNFISEYIHDRRPQALVPEDAHLRMDRDFAAELDEYLAGLAPVLRIHDYTRCFATDSGQAIGMVLLYEIEQCFPHLASQVEGARRIRGADQYTDLHCTLVGFRHLGHANPPVPLRKNAAKALRFGA